MDIISYSCTIMCIIIISKYTKILSFTYRYLRDKWHKIIWNAIWIFAYSSTLMSTYRVKVS